MRQYKFSPISVLVVGALLCSPLATHAEFKQNLQYGMTDSVAVKDLQDFLTAEGYYSGKITGSYFSFTRRAVRNFQTENGIEPATGIFGPLTRKLANGILNPDDASSSAPTDMGVASSSTSTADADTQPGTISSTIQDLLVRVQALEDVIAELTAPSPSTSTYTSTNTTPTTSTATKTTTATTTTTKTTTATTTTTSTATTTRK